MEEKILQLKELYNQGIDKILFYQLILHSTNGHSEPTSIYANNKNVEEWVSLYNEDSIKLEVSNIQIELFFNYMSKYHYHFFGKDQGRFSINKYFNKEEKSKDKFLFEEITFTVLDLK
jgi:hypothetical protein